VSAANARRTRHARRGFTLVELMVTVMLLALGLTGVVATSSAVSRMMGASLHEASASLLAASRFETLRGSTCASIVAGTASANGITEKWVVTAITPRLLDVTDSVTFTPMSRRASVTQAYRSFVRC
jgi:prepilin-type N-terminal cleavage/methylation domain-containing protein